MRELQWSVLTCIVSEFDGEYTAVTDDDGSRCPAAPLVSLNRLVAVLLMLMVSVSVIGVAQCTLSNDQVIDGIDLKKKNPHMHSAVMSTNLVVVPCVSRVCVPLMVLTATHQTRPE